MNIREISEKIGVSSATVSRVINRSGYVSEETRNKVLKAIEEYNYVPSAIARSLSIQNTSSIGVIVPDIENPFFASVIKGITEVAEKHKFNILFFGTNETLELEHAYLETVVRQRLNGVIITPISEDDKDTKERLLKLRKSKIPVVLVDRDINDVDFDGVFIDNFQSAYEGVTALIKEGHKRIATITGPLSTRPGSGRLEGYKKALNDHGIEIQKSYILEGDFKADRSYELTENLLSNLEPPTAIFTSNNLTTLGCLKYLTEKNLIIGKDISLIGFDDIEVLRIIDYKLSVIERDAYVQGKEAMNILVERLEDNKDKYKTKRVVLPHEVILRGSEKLIKGSKP